MYLKINYIQLFPNSLTEYFGLKKRKNQKTRNISDTPVKKQLKTNKSCL